MNVFHWTPLSSSFGRSRLAQATILLGVSLLISGGSGATWGWQYVQEQLAPRISEELSHSFNRPITIGSVESVTLNSIRFGASSMAATEADQDTLTIRAIEVTFSPMALVRHQNLTLDITLHDPVLVVDEQPAGWIELELPAQGDDQIEIQRLQVRNATIQLIPLSSESETELDIPPSQIVQFDQVQGWIAFADATQPTTFQIEGLAAAGGNLAVQGAIARDAQAQSTSGTPSESLSLQVQTQDLAIAPFEPFLPPTLSVQSGILNSDLVLTMAPGTPWQVAGHLQIDQGTVQVQGEPNLFRYISAEMQLRDQQIYLSDGQVQFGGIPFENVSGVVDLQAGLSLTADVKTVSVEAFMKTFKLRLPFPVEGALTAQQLSIAGAFDQVVFAGRVRNAEPLTLDRVVFPAAQTDFTFQKSTNHLILSDFQASPATGGEITLASDLRLGKKTKGETAQVHLTAQLDQISLDELRQIYPLPLPEMPLGQLYAQAQVEVFNQQPRLQMDWVVRNGTYPAVGQIQADAHRIRLTETQVQLAEGQVLLEGAIAQDTWQVKLQGENVPLLALGVNHPGTIVGAVNLQGSGSPLEISTLQGDAQGRLDLNGNATAGYVDAQMAFAAGGWQAQFNPVDVSLSALAPSWPGRLQGEILASGAVHSLTPKAIAATAQIEVVDLLPWSSVPLTADLRWHGDRLEIVQANLAHLQAAGEIAVETENGWRFTPGAIALEVSAQKVDLATLSTLMPLPLSVSGWLTAAGTVRGTLDQPELLATVDLQQGAVQGVALEEHLQGSVSATPTQMGLHLAGDRDQIQLQTQMGNWLSGAGSILPATTLHLQRDRTALHGMLTATGELSLTLQDLPLTDLAHWMPLPLALSDAHLAGDLSGQVKTQLHPHTPLEAIAILELKMPASESAVAPVIHQLTGTLRYADQTLHLAEGALRLGESTIALSGTTALSPFPSGHLHLHVEQAEIQNLLTVLPRLSSELEREPEESVLGLPPLRAIAGQISGDLTLVRSPQGALSAQISLLGEDWRWGDYQIGQLHLPASALSLQQPLALPFQLTGVTHRGATVAPVDTRLMLSGEWNAAVPTGQIQLDPVPLAFVADMVQFPLNLGGEVGAIATVSGSLDHPHIHGEIELLNAQVHTFTIPHAKVGFSYGAAGFTLEHWHTLQALSNIHSGSEVRE